MRISDWSSDVCSSDLLDPGDQVHRAAHALDHLAGHHPVGEITGLGDLHAAQPGEVDMAAADHREALLRHEIGGLRPLADLLLAGVDQDGVIVALAWEGAVAPPAVPAPPRPSHGSTNSR